MIATAKTVTEALRGVLEPETRKNVVALALLRAIDVKDDTVRVTLAFTGTPCAVIDDLQRQVEALLRHEFPALRHIYVETVSGEACPEGR